MDVWLHRDDKFLYRGVVEQGRLFGLRVERQPPIDRYFEPGVPFKFGDLTVDILHTPGHCPGGVCLAIGPEELTGTHAVRGRHAVCRIDRPDGPARRRHGYAVALDP